jgi:hypothetical protein
VVGLPVHRGQNLLHCLVAAVHTLADTAVQSHSSAVQSGETLFDRAVLDNDELPVLTVGTSRRFERQLDAAQHDVVVDRIWQQPPNGALREHCLFERHLQTDHHVSEAAATCGVRHVVPIVHPFPLVTR